MACHLKFLLVRFFHDHTHLLDGECWMSPVGVDLNQVSTVSDLLARGATRFLNTAYHLRPSRKIGKIGRYAERLILTDGCNGAGRHLHARAFGQSLLDGIAECNVRISRAFILDVADGRKTGVQRQTRIEGTFERPESLRLRRQSESVAVVSVGHPRHDMGVAVNEAGQDCRASQVYNLCIFRRMKLNVRGWSNFLETLALDPD